MNSSTYTHAEWRVRPGAAEAFIAAWRELAATFASLERPPLWGTLLRSESDPHLFYSFGPWASADDVAAMRAHPGSQAAMAQLKEHCESATPGSFQLVAHVAVRT